MTGILLAGCGRMGGALVTGWLEDGSIREIAVVEPGGAVPADPRVRAFPAAGSLPADLAPDMVCFAVKPQLLDQVAPDYRRFVESGAAVLSVAAGKTLAGFARHFGAAARVVRSMPNTPAAIGRGITVCVGSAGLDEETRGLATRLMGAVGAVEWVEDEALLDAVTAVSGSGPAYVFLMIEALAEAGTKAGLPAALAMRLARATVAGAGELARVSPESAAALRRGVTSPGGTTQAALDVLMSAEGLQPLLDRAVAAAAIRSRQLAGTP